jgi:hypothetical protein
MYVSEMRPNLIPTNPYHIKHISFVFCQFLLGTIISPAHELRRIWQQISQLMGITHGRDQKYFPPQILLYYKILLIGWHKNQMCLKDKARR